MSINNMKKGVLLIFLSILFFNFILAEEIYDINNVNLSNLSQEEIQELMNEYEISQKDIQEYVSEENLQIEDFNYSQISCDVIKDFINPEIVGIEIPEQVPISNEIIALYIDEKHIGNVVIEESIIKEFSCSENESTYNLYVTKKFVSDASKIKDIEISKIIDFYKENKKSGDIKIKATGIIRNIKLFVLNIGLSMSKLFF